MIVLGLTGSIGMGKSTAAAVLRALGLPLFDADEVVHRLLEPRGAAAGLVAASFADVGSEAGGIDRGLLGRRVFADAASLSRLVQLSEDDSEFWRQLPWRFVLNL